MKKLFFVFIILVVSLLIKAQVWAPTGATWHYNWVEMAESGYVKIQYASDSIVGGKLCKVLKKERYSYDWINQIYSGGVIGYEYTYFENNTVYYYRYGQFFKLYDFTATSGSSWEVAGWDPPFVCDSTGTIIVDSVGTTIINSFSLNYLNISPGSTSEWSLGERIIERIGSLGYMFPEPICVADVYEGGSLRCYYDDSFGLYQIPGYAHTCDYITRIDKNPHRRSDIKIYPIPASSTITIEINNQGKDNLIIELPHNNGEIELQLFDLTGRLQSTTYITLNQEKALINVSTLKPGIYLLKITDGEMMIGVKKVVVVR